MPVWQHAFVQDTDNFNCTIGGYPIKDDVASMWILSVARIDFIAGLPQIWVFTQKVETLVELENVLVSLISTPFTLRVSGNRFEVSFGLPGKLETWHQRPSLSSS